MSNTPETNVIVINMNGLPACFSAANLHGV